MKKRNSVIIGIVLVILLAIVIACTAVWLYAMPKLSLAKAVPSLFLQLKERFRDDPGKVLLEMMDENGCYTAEICVSGENAIIGPVTYQMTVQTDGSKHCISAAGTAATASRSLDLRLYCDKEFMAVSSDDLVQGTYYGLTYDTFAQDIRGIPLIETFVSNRQLQQWDTSVQNIRRTVTRPNRKNISLSIPSFSEDDLKALSLGLIILPSSHQKTEIPLNGEVLSCQELIFSLNGSQLKSWIPNLSAFQISEDTVLTAHFFLYQETVVQCVLQVLEDSKPTKSYVAVFGKNPAIDTLSLETITENEGEENHICLSVDTRRTNGYFEETWTMTEGTSHARKIFYSWEPVSETMTLQTETMVNQAVFTMEKRGGEIYLSTSDFAPLFHALTGVESPIGAFQNAPCTMRITKGSEITTPAYKNIDQWSFEDFFLLLGGIGSMLGISGLR